MSKAKSSGAIKIAQSWRYSVTAKQSALLGVLARMADGTDVHTSYAEIAEHLDCSLVTAKRRVAELVGRKIIWKTNHGSGKKCTFHFVEPVSKAVSKPVSKSSIIDTGLQCKKTDSHYKERARAVGIKTLSNKYTKTTPESSPVDGSGSSVRVKGRKLTAALLGKAMADVTEAEVDAVLKLLRRDTEASNSSAESVACGSPLPSHGNSESRHTRGSVGPERLFQQQPDRSEAN